MLSNSRWRKFAYDEKKARLIIAAKSRIPGMRISQPQEVAEDAEDVVNLFGAKSNVNYEVLRLIG